MFKNFPIFFSWNFFSRHFFWSINILDFSQLRISKIPPPPSQFCYHYYDRCAQSWIDWKIKFQIFIFWVLVNFVLKIHQKLTNFVHKNDLRAVVEELRVQLLQFLPGYQPSIHPNRPRFHTEQVEIWMIIKYFFFVFIWFDILLIKFDLIWSDLIWHFSQW